VLTGAFLQIHKSTNYCQTQSWLVLQMDNMKTLVSNLKDLPPRRSLAVCLSITLLIGDDTGRRRAPASLCRFSNRAKAMSSPALTRRLHGEPPGAGGQGVCKRPSGLFSALDGQVTLPPTPCHEASSRKVAPGEAILLYVLTFVAALIGGFTFGLVGIGLPLVLVPALSILFGDVRTAVVVASIPSLFSAIYIACAEDLRVRIFRSSGRYFPSRSWECSLATKFWYRSTLPR
jgi:hypothetical protein